ncbi:hypothetical protein KFE80_03285 [bacterium SCSIO 12696]|nr:hypothetical protein KFE80_03285 [bacterium SCSIO 12696]
MITLKLNSADQLQSVDTHYQYHDHLGSLDVITDETGAIVQEMSFDAWGERRGATDWTALANGALTTFDSSITTRGFTGHEMLDEVGVIHMNGRIYDPKIARFLQADPFIQDPLMTQSLNRYAYVINNPLNATDPSGYFFKKFAGLIVGAILVIATGGAASALLAGWGAVGLGAITGAISAAVNGGNILKGALTGAITGALIPANLGIDPISVTGVLTYGAIGGIANVLQGGKFGHGFISAGVGAIAGTLLKGTKAVSTGLGRIITKSVIGGTISRLTGGKFSNGAVSGAFAAIVAELSDSINKRLKQSGPAPTNSKLTLKQRREKAQKEVDALLTNGTLDKDKVFTGKTAMDDAAKEVLTEIQPISDKYDIEIAGGIRENGDGYSYNRPEVGINGTSASIDPRGIAAGYHTHPGGGFNSQFFSNKHTVGQSADIEWSTRNGIPLYMSHSHRSLTEIRVCKGGYNNCHQDFDPHRRMSHFGVSGKLVK